MVILVRHYDAIANLLTVKEEEVNPYFAACDVVLDLAIKASPFSHQLIFSALPAFIHRPACELSMECFAHSGQCAEEEESECLSSLVVGK